MESETAQYQLKAKTKRYATFINCGQKYNNAQDSIHAILINIVFLFVFCMYNYDIKSIFISFVKIWSKCSVCLTF